MSKGQSATTDAPPLNTANRAHMVFWKIRKEVIFIICELLDYGADSAKTGKELAAALHTDIRSVTALVETERRQGQPICAATGGKRAGYYLAANQHELDMQCNKLFHRAGELHKTRNALKRIRIDE